MSVRVFAILLKRLWLLLLWALAALVCLLEFLQWFCAVLFWMMWMNMRRRVLGVYDLWLDVAWRHLLFFTQYNCSNHNGQTNQKCCGSKVWSPHCLRNIGIFMTGKVRTAIGICWTFAVTVTFPLWIRNEPCQKCKDNKYNKNPVSHYTLCFFGIHGLLGIWAYIKLSVVTTIK